MEIECTLCYFNIAMENHHQFSRGKSTINGHFSIAMLNYQRVKDSRTIMINPKGVGRTLLICRKFYTSRHRESPFSGQWPISNESPQPLPAGNPRFL
jgi:hypothetical protein